MRDGDRLPVNGVITFGAEIRQHGVGADKFPAIARKRKVDAVAGGGNLRLGLIETKDEAGQNGQR